MVRSGAPPTMETTFYEEQAYHPLSNSVNHLKRSMTLDLNAARQPHKRASRFGAPVLSSPDLSMLKMASPEMEKFLISQNGLVTPTPTNNPILFNHMPTEEQEMYARGFVDALNELHHSDSSQGPLQINDLSGPTYTNLDRLPPSQQYPAGAPFGPESIVVKDEPQTVPSVGSSPPLSPIDMESQEKIKLERKRQRNRLAASKCRRRKLERISRLEDKVKLLKSENSELSSVMAKLKEHVCRLKEQVMEHFESGCQITSASFNGTF